jgi:hypothetical protein
MRRNLEICGVFESPARLPDGTAVAQSAVVESTLTGSHHVV